MQNTNKDLDTSRKELQSLNKELSILNTELGDRNRELSRANDDMKNLLASANQRLGDALRVMERVRILSHRLVTVQEKERQEISHELHDEVGGALTAIKLALGRSQKKLGDKAQLELKNVNALLDKAMDLVSKLSQNMRPAILDEFGLVEALKWYFERYTEQTGIKVSFKQQKFDERCHESIKITAYRIIQESLTNVAHYAGVEQVNVSVHTDLDKLYIRVEDGGCGFDPFRIGTTSSGITGMQDRAFVAGGKLAVNSSPGEGTCVTCELPLNIT